MVFTISSKNWLQDMFSPLICKILEALNLKCFVSQKCGFRSYVEHIFCDTTTLHISFIFSYVYCLEQKISRMISFFVSSFLTRVPSYFSWSTSSFKYYSLQKQNFMADRLYEAWRINSLNTKFSWFSDEEVLRKSFCID